MTVRKPAAKWVPALFFILLILPNLPSKKTTDGSVSAHSQSISTIYPVTSQQLPADLPVMPSEELPDYLDHHPELINSAPYLADLARIEYAAYLLRIDPPQMPGKVTRRTLNPSLELFPVRWSGLPDILSDTDRVPHRQDAFVAVYQKPGRETIKVETLTTPDLLALKIFSEGIDSSVAAEEGGISRGEIDDVIYSAITRGLLLEPESRLIRDPGFPCGIITDPEPFIVNTFTLQWHITQRCDLHCRHCYDRSDRRTLPLDEAISILDDLYEFCRQNHVFGQVTFTGGNPLLYPSFNELYREAAERGFIIAILGNPAPRKLIEELAAVQKPAFYQVSLEGLQQHNDFMRGEGHFNRVMEFLPLLAELDVYSMVMLTLTQDNIDQVIDLGAYLKDRVNQFTFNRLAMVGEGADLVSVKPSAYTEFLEKYLKASKANPHMALKDNLFNLVLHRKGWPLVGGCTGSGCGAAFNFAALLPDGEVHACRKFPSPIGNIREQHFSEIYQGALAKKYRAGSSGCRNCEIRPVCGSCLAVSHGFGKDIFTDLDPYCFI